MADSPFQPDNPHGLLLYDHPSSPCARRVRIALVEKGLHWDTQLVDLSRLEQRRPEYLRLNPNGFVPTLAHGERVIYESNVITEYLDDVFPEPPLYPSDPWQLVQVKTWQAAELAMAKDYRTLMYQRVMGPLIHLTRTLDEALAIAKQSTRDAADLAWEERVWRLAVLSPEEEQSAASRLWQWLERLERRLDGRNFLVGEQFTQAEISVFPRVMMYAFVQLHITADRFSNVRRWMDALATRPSFATTLSAEDAQLLKLSKTRLLPWLARVFRKPRPGPTERVRLWFVRRLARRAMRSPRRDTAQRRGVGPLRQPGRGAIAPTDTPARRGPPLPAARLAEPIALYDSVYSPHARRIRMLLREKGLEWQTVEVDLLRLAQKTPKFLALNPNGEVPVLRHGERIICDSQLIAEYLDRTYPGNPFYPDDAFATAQVRMWLALESGTHKEFRPLFYLYVIRPALQAAGIRESDLEPGLAAGVDPSHVEWLRDTLRGTVRFDTSEALAREIIAGKLAIIDAHLSDRSYFVGDRCTMADLAWFTRIDVLPRLGVPVDADRFPHIARWFETIAARTSAGEPGV